MRFEGSEHPVYVWLVKKITKSVGHHIRDWRLYRGLTLRRLEERMEREPGVPLISRVSLGRIERGEQPYSQPVLEALAQAFECTPDELLTVDPSKDGMVIDLMRRIRKADPALIDQLSKIARAIA